MVLLIQESVVLRLKKLTFELEVRIQKFQSQTCSIFC